MRLRPWMIALVAASLFVGGCGPDGDDDDDDDTATPNPAAQNQRSGPGDYALDYLTDGDYQRLTIEIDYMEDPNPNDTINNAPSQEALDRLLTTLDRFCNKAVIVYDQEATDVVPIPTDSEGNLKEDYTRGDIDALELEYRDLYRQGDEAVLYFLYVNGRYVTDDGEATTVVGFAHHGSSMAVFKGVINEIRVAANRSFYERAVIIHEVGHLLGLVTTGIPAQADHVDDDPNAGRGVHCSNPDCIMFWQVNSVQFIQTIINGQDRDFDQDCQDDIAAAGGKGGETSRIFPASPARPALLPAAWAELHPLGLP